MMRAAGIAAVALLLGGTPAIAAPELGPAYGSGMVVQRDLPIVIEGNASPGNRVSGTLGAVRASASAGGDGRFELTFPARSASNEGVTLTIDDGHGSTSISDILVGDVWLCSGQSNMELSVNRALNTWNELRMSRDDGVRLLMIPKATAAVPTQDFAAPVSWQAAKPETVAEFSAACFYMAKALRNARKDVPVGLIHSNWGGSAARAWFTPESVAKIHGQVALDQLQQYETDPMGAAQAFVPQWFDWWRSMDGGREPWKDPSSLAWKPVPQISFWNEWTGSGLDTDATANVWLRKSFELTAEQVAAGGTLSIGAIDDLDLTWVNGNVVGYTFGWGVERHYRIPADYLRAGRNEVLIAANNMWDTGGFFAGADRLWFETASGARLPLGEGWEYSVSAIDGVPPRAPWDANAGLGVMHNRMVAPLGSMKLAGVAWYQGESDVGQADYDTKLRELFAGWRRQFGEQTQMLVVQLADYGPRTAKPVASGWAQLRQDQLDGVVADGNAALVTAIDIGEPTDIHPANKNDLGKRLAMAALGQPMPMPAAAHRVDGAIVVSFTGIEGGLSALGGPAALGFELCGETQASCRYVIPKIEGDSLVIADDGSPATRVRHAWADSPIVNLYDARGLPVPGFELEID